MKTFPLPASESTFLCPAMQYKIPQNVQVEDKIVGPLTLKQLIILGVGGGFTYALYTILVKKYYMEVWLPAILPSGLLTLAIAFLSINGIPFFKWVFLVLVHLKNPRVRSFSLGKADLFEATLFRKADADKQISGLKEAGEKKDRDDRDLTLKDLSQITKIVDHESVS